MDRDMLIGIACATTVHTSVVFWEPEVDVGVLAPFQILLSSLPLAQRMLDQPVFSSRPVLPFAGALVGYENALAMLPYGDRFRALRRYLHQYMGTQKSMEHHWTVQEGETHRFVARLVNAVEGKEDTHEEDFVLFLQG